MERLRKTLVGLTVIILLSTLASAASQAKPDCDEWCGDLRIPYPFGVKQGCYFNQAFLITCDKAFNPPKAFLKDTNISVTNISLNGELHMLQPIVRYCYEDVQLVSGTPFIPNTTNLSAPATLPIADGKNKFIAIGCNTFGLFTGMLKGGEFLTGCVAICTNNSIIVDGSCSGTGCCELDIPNGLSDLSLAVGPVLPDTNRSLVKNNSCGYAFVVGEEGFKFKSSFIDNFEDKEVEVVVDWSIGNETIIDVCGINSKRNSSFSDDRSQYRCQCPDGYEGNPYLPQGCDQELIMMFVIIKVSERQQENRWNETKDYKN
uniref:Wall-associated receptor kinase galacturonan-binding domain-containing protein n=1 Tax=Cucumis sativus TaxID=3659 RepID=A0A0A0KCX3_CUCSA